jgi:hypothetical protein
LAHPIRFFRRLVCYGLAPFAIRGPQRGWSVRPSLVPNTNAAPLDLPNKLLEPADKQFRCHGSPMLQSLKQAISLHNLTPQ